MLRLAVWPLAVVAAVAALWLDHHQGGLVTGLRVTGALCCLTTAAFLLWLTALHVMTEGRSPADEGSHSRSRGAWSAAATPADKAALAAEIDALAADTMTLMVSESGAIFALDESDAPDRAEEADQ